MTLKCAAVACVHNIGNYCEAAVIHVKGGDTMEPVDTYCDTYSDKVAFNRNASQESMHAIKGLIDPITVDQTMDPTVACTAVNCVYNEGYSCGANDVDIIGPGSFRPEHTECQTFQIKT